MSAASIWLMLANCPSTEDAERIGRALLDADVVKSVNVSARMRTLYRWEGELVENQEVQLILKLPGAHLDAAEALIKRLHPFEVPAIIAWRADRVSESYARYILGQRS
ncbi:MAG: divalent-cation tolerance protein CutA [Pseudomonadota bacterium]